MFYTTKEDVDYKTDNKFSLNNKHGRALRACVNHDGAEA